MWGKEKLRVAFFNWRDINHPMAGGAEVYVHMLLKRLRAKGHDVALFSSTFPGASARETIDGIAHFRFGGRFSMYAKSFFCYHKHIRGKFDIIVESINGVPFFTPLFAREKVVPLVHQLTRENWYSALPFPVAFAGYHFEDALLRLYANLPAIVPSESTRSDLKNLGFKDVRIIYGAASILPPDGVRKEPVPTLVYLGRLAKSKRVDHALRAFSILQKSIPDAVLWIAGSGPDESRLRKLSSALGLGQAVKFFGRVGEREKTALLAKAHLMLFPAAREGWGLVVLEANACGTPVLGYRVPGLCDSIREGENGFLVVDGDIRALAQMAESLLKDARLLRRLSASSAAYCGKFSWDDSSDLLESALFSALRGKKPGRA